MTTLEVEIGRTSLRTAQTKILQNLISKISRAKWTRGVAQVVKRLLFECLLCKYEALSPNPTPTKKKLVRLCPCETHREMMSL
jgi:hypothetical protein